MQGKLEARTDYQSKIYNNPIELLKAIKEHALNYQGSRYEMAIINNAVQAFLIANKKKKRICKIVPGDSG